MSESQHYGDLPPELNPRGRGAGGPRGPRSRGSKIARVLSWIAVLTSVVVLVGSGVAYLGVRKLTTNIERIDDVFDPPCKPTREDPCEKRPEKREVAGQVTNYLIIGSDSADGISPKERARLRIKDVDNRTGQRSDTMLLVHVPADAKGAYVMSFPRDLYVDIPGLGRKEKINAAFATGGAQRAVKTVEQLTGVHIDHYLEINVLSFANIVDGLGGVPICIPKAMKSKKAHLDIPAGQHTLDGPTALSYVRARTFDPDSEYQDRSSDLGRIRRQQQFIGAVVRRAVSSDTLANPLRLARVLDRSTKALKADEDLGPRQLKLLAERFRNLDTKRVQFASVPLSAAAVRVPNGQLVAMMDEPAAHEIFEAIANGTVLDPKAKPSPTKGPKLTVPPASIQVLVRNGNGVAGQAGTTAESLRGVGFQVTGVANADRSNYAETIVRHAPDKLQSAQTLSAAIPGSRLEQVDDLGGTLEVVVGLNYTTVKRVVVTGTGSASPSPKPTPTTAEKDPCA